MDDRERSARQYDAMAGAYADNAHSAYNAYYERPATIGLLGDVGGRRVLEAGCGAGQLTAWLAGHGAAVIAAQFQVSFWRRPLTAMAEAIASAGFVIERLAEPAPLAELADRDPAAYQAIRTKPRFLFFRLGPAVSASWVSVRGRG
jgi:SAM-dependent methyltransferase